MGESQLSVAQAKAEQENAKLLATATSNSEAAKIKVDKETEVAVFESLQVIREHNLEMAKLEVQEALARKAKIVISGDQGDSLINSILDKELLTSSISLNYKK